MVVSMRSKQWPCVGRHAHGDVHIWWQCGSSQSLHTQRDNHERLKALSKLACSATCCCMLSSQVLSTTPGQYAGPNLVPAGIIHPNDMIHALCVATCRERASGNMLSAGAPFGHSAVESITSGSREIAVLACRHTMYRSG